MSIEQVIIEKLRTLPIEQQREALNFVEFLQAKQKQSNSQAESNHQTLQGQVLRYDDPFEVAAAWESERSEAESALEAAVRVLSTVGDGAPDLSTNRSYLAEYGQS